MLTVLNTKDRFTDGLTDWSTLLTVKIDAREVFEVNDQNGRVACGEGIA